MAFDIAYVLSAWEAAGIYDFVLPFLLIFAVIFGVLRATNILGDNSGVAAVVSLTISLLALRVTGDYLIPRFFQEIFPRFAVVLSILIVLLILVGLFIPKEHVKGWFIGFGSVAAIAGVVIVVQSFERAGLSYGGWWTANWPTVLFVIALVVVIIAVFMEKAPKDKESGTITFPLGKIR
jgi:hypothetical protein